MKEERIRVLLPDYFDGSVKLPPSLERNPFFRMLQEVVPEIAVVKIEKESMTLSPSLLHTITEIDESKVPYAKLMANALRAFIRVWNGYISGDKRNNNYIYSKNLVTAFETSSLNVKVDLLPEEFHGFIDFQNKYLVDGRLEGNLLGSFISIKDKRLTVLAFFTKDGQLAPSYHSYYLDTGDTIDEVISNFDKQIEEAPILLRMLLTAVLYVTHAPDDLIQHLNDFPRSLITAKKLEAHYTRKPCVVVGKFFTLPKVYNDKWIQNKGYFGWRWAGVGRSYLKYTWISPSKPYQKGT